MYGDFEFVHIYVCEGFNERFSSYLMREMYSEGSCIFILTLQAYSFDHAFDKYAAHGLNKDRRRLHVPGMVRVEKLGGQPAGSM